MIVVLLYPAHTFTIGTQASTISGETVICVYVRYERYERTKKTNLDVECGCCKNVINGC